MLVLSSTSSCAATGRMFLLLQTAAIEYFRRLIYGLFKDATSLDDHHSILCQVDLDLSKLAIVLQKSKQIQDFRPTLTVSIILGDPDLKQLWLKEVNVILSYNPFSLLFNRNSNHHGLQFAFRFDIKDEDEYVVVGYEDKLRLGLNDMKF
ncbi:hypothetical protein Tco_0273635 [Tanacetum coccineum]